MTEIDFEVVEGEYGEQIAIKFDYDEKLTDKIKELRDDRYWGRCHCSPVWDESGPGEDEFKFWAIDRTAEAVEVFHEVVGYPIPPEVQPAGADNNDGDELLLEVPEGEAWFYPRDAPREVHEMLDSAFSYDNPDSEHSAMAKPKIHIYDRGRGRGPMGLVDRAADAAEAMGYEPQVEVRGDRSGKPIDVEWGFPHDLRGYQDDAADAVLDRGGGIVSLPTGAGKTVTALDIVRRIGQDAIVFVHTKELLWQWADEIRDILGVEPGVIGDGEWSTGPITVCTMQTLMSRGFHELDDPGVMIFDECHRTSAAEQMHEIGLAIDAEYRIGLSATPWRRVSGAELKIEGAVGGVAAEATAEELIDAGYLAEPRFGTIEHDGPSPIRGSEYHEAYERCIEESDARNDAIADEAARLASGGYTTLVNVDRVDQGDALAEQIRELGAEARFLCGSDPTSRREEVLDGLAGDKVDVLVSTLVKEGVDIPALDAVVLAHGGRSDISTLQVIGRALRPQGGKDHAMIVDVADEGRFFGHAHRERQQTMREYYGEYGPDPPGESYDTGSTDEPSTSLSEPLSDEEEAEMEAWLSGEEEPGGALDEEVAEVADWLGMDASEVDR